MVASHVGAIPDLITDGVNGYLVPPDDEQALANALTAAFRADATGMAGNARQSVAHLDWRLVARRYRSHFETAINRFERGG